MSIEKTVEQIMVNREDASEQSLRIKGLGPEAILSLQANLGVKVIQQETPWYKPVEYEIRWTPEQAAARRKSYNEQMSAVIVAKKEKEERQAASWSQYASMLNSSASNLAVALLQEGREEPDECERRLAMRFIRKVAPTDTDFQFYIGLHPEEFREDFVKFIKKNIMRGVDALRDCDYAEHGPASILGLDDEELGGTQVRNGIKVVANAQVWTKEVKDRDGYKCMSCGKAGCAIEAHHIKRQADYPMARLVVNNGISLCEECHSETLKKEALYEGRFNEILRKAYGEDYADFDAGPPVISNG